MPYGYGVSDRQEDQAGKVAKTAIDTFLNSGNSWLDLTLNFQRELQRAAFQSFSSYSPAADTRISGRVPQAGTTGVQVVPVGEERLNVAVHTVQGETTRVRRRVVAQPVEQQVTLRDEKVVFERRRPTSPEAKGNVLSETVVEMSDSHQVPTVWKSQHVAEEVVLRMQVTERTETVRDTVRRDVVDVEHDRGAIAPRTGNVPANPLPASLTPVDETPRVIGQAARAAEAAEKKPAASLPAGTRA